MFRLTHLGSKLGCRERWAKEPAVSQMDLRRWDLGSLGVVGNNMEIHGNPIEIQRASHGNLKFAGRSSFSRAFDGYFDVSISGTMTVAIWKDGIARPGQPCFNDLAWDVKQGAAWIETGEALDDLG